MIGVRLCAKGFLFVLLGTVLVCLGILTKPMVAIAETAKATNSVDDVEADGIVITVGNVSFDDWDVLSLDEKGATNTTRTDKVKDQLEGAGMGVTSEFMNGEGGIVVARLAQGQSLDNALKVARQISGVTSAQPNYVYELVDDMSEGDLPEESLTLQSKLESALVVNDPYAKLSNPTARLNQYWAYRSNLPEAWADAGNSSHRSTVAVLDSTIYAAHEDLSANILSSYAYDALNDRPMNLGSSGPTSNNGHGSHIAGIIAATSNNGRGIAGASYNCCVLPIMVLSDAGRGNTASIVRGIAYTCRMARSHPEWRIHIINMSLKFTSASAGYDTLLHRSVRSALNDYGIICVCAGGNRKTPAGPRTVDGGAYPSDFDECVSVTALGTDDSDWEYTELNAEKDISAPGVSITSVGIGSQDSYTKFSGSSQATAVTSGSFALLFAAVPTATPDQVREAIYGTARTVRSGAKGRRPTNGSHGALDARAALRYLKVHHFTDIDYRNDWVYTEGWLSYVTQNGLMNGYAGTNLFAPNDLLTRGQLATILYRRANPHSTATTNDANYARNETPFWDNASRQYYTAAINWSYKQGIFIGDDGSKTVRPDAGLTREEAALVLYRYAIKHGASPSGANASSYASVPDAASVDSWASAGVGWCFAHGLMTGDAVTHILDPRGVTTRAQMAKLVTVLVRDTLS